MSDSWIIGAIILVLFLVVGTSFYSEKVRRECRVELSKTNKSTEDVMKICR